MKNTIVVIMVILVALVAVGPAYADGGTVKPACTEKDGFLARLFGKCVVLDSNQKTTTQQGDTVGETMTESNPVYDNTTSATCKVYFAAPPEQRNPAYKDMCEK